MSPAPVFRGTAPITLTLTAPWGQLTSKKDAWVKAKLLSPRPEVEGKIEIAGQACKVDVSPRGNSSLTFYAMPKITVDLPKTGMPSELSGLKAVKVGNHTAAQGTEGEARPWREGAAYQVLEAIGVPTLKVRAASITYTETSQTRASPGKHNALLLEDTDDAAKRFGGKEFEVMHAGRRIDVARHPAVSALKLMAKPDDLVRLSLGALLVGNGDQILSFEKSGAVLEVWNYKVVQRADKSIMFLACDFDQSSMASLHPPDAERMKTYFNMFARDCPASFRRVRAEILERDDDARAAVKNAPLDAKSRAAITRHVDTFFRCLRAVKVPARDND